MSDTPNSSASSALRQSCRLARHAALSTIASDHKQVADGWPAVSMVVPAIGIDGTPILLISDLADHTRHIRADNRVSLLFTNPSAAPGSASTIETDNARITVFGRAVRDDSAITRACYLRAQPDAAQYADFADFAFYRIEVDAIYWVGGFGKQRRLNGHQFLVEDCSPLIAGHDSIISHMNADHLDALAAIVGHFTTHDPSAGWRMHSIDCDGMVLIASDANTGSIRIDFARTIRTPGDAREILVEMCKISRT